MITRLKLEGEFVYSTQKVLEVAWEEETKQVVKQPRGRPRKIKEVEEVEEVEEAEICIDSSLA